MFCGRDVCDLNWRQGASRDCFIHTYYSTWEQTLLLFFYSFDPVSESEFRRIPKEGHITDLQQSRKYSTTCNVALLYNSVVY